MNCIWNEIALLNLNGKDVSLEMQNKFIFFFIFSLPPFFGFVFVFKKKQLGQCLKIVRKIIWKFLLSTGNN